MGEKRGSWGEQGSREVCLMWPEAEVEQVCGWDWGLGAPWMGWEGGCPPADHQGSLKGTEASRRAWRRATHEPH